ncbi:putative NRPS-like protein biosynthetic cluster [Elasticomyces elasticus]|uniref:Carrier domain-containing protein n=1 Tax=Exophiala sideris TaxID=1016849 RepID=A0ABR0J331_9EURO|nr:putative NRPS-like protein biosynthetic cluster [Elasticomyces elasticus]KAK5024922.1 hypothetical protein LTS07_008300 [Exophiala sideris]KAK5031489.1 putative NRPS-like protein biosynthetic cluster [Exophiala sideris]KAK5054961.1 hypothetical protein LTR69_008529 [Exophiala sideris]KAK5179841.1 putative NRPS-like protein biosynthetic cluster [Eurotiomycetes sp. CCFEE 6388]
MVFRAAIKIGCPFTPINLRSPKNAKEIRHMLTLTKAKAIIVDNNSVAEDLQRNAGTLMNDMQVRIILDGGDGVHNYLSFSALIEEAAIDKQFEESSLELNRRLRNEDDVVYIGFTSGTTSLPKAAPHTNKSLACNMKSWEKVFSLDPTRSWLHILPMNSIVGSSWTLAYLIAGGSVTHVNYAFEPDSVAAAICTGDYTDLLAVPSMIDLLATSPSLSEPSNKGIDRMIVGGSKILRSHVEKSFQKIKCKRFSPFFGMTEGTSVCTETLYEIPENVQDPIYAGYANPGCKIRICDPDKTEPVPRGTPGEIVQGGLQRIERYLGGSEMIIRGGMNIASAAVEAVIAERTGIDSQVVGIPDEVAGEVPVAIIKHPKDDKEAVTRVQRCVLDAMGPAYALERVLSLEELRLEDWPKTTSGKVLKRELQVIVKSLTKTQQPAPSAPVHINGHTNGHAPMSDEAQLQNYLLDCVRAHGMLITSVDDDFHSSGMDSLLGLRLRNAILKDGDPIWQAQLPPTVIFQCGNIRRLAEYLLKLNTNAHALVKDESHVDGVVEEMFTMVEELSHFQPHKPQRRKTSGGHTVLLTGATGSLGAHILAVLLAQPDVDLVYCVVRGNNPADRLEESLAKRMLTSSEYSKKVRVVKHEAGKPLFALEETTREAMRDKLTHIIHAAWPVNFHLPLVSFRKHLLDLQSLVQLSLDVRAPQPAHVLYCSSMGVALNTKGQSRISEEPIMDFRQGISNGYTQSKLVAEYVLQRAMESFDARTSVLRIGQIVGDTRLGLWNESEAAPLMIRSALTLDCLPLLDMKCSWIPVDFLASAIVDLTRFTRREELKFVYNMCNPYTFSWTEDLLPALAKAGLKFDKVSFVEWLARLKNYDATHTVEEATKSCPAVKLIDFWEQSYGGTRQRHSKLEFATHNAERDCKSMHFPPDVIANGLIKKMLDAWMSTWASASVSNETKPERTGQSLEDGEGMLS